jgi:hypothetical protein
MGRKGIGRRPKPGTKGCYQKKGPRGHSAFDVVLDEKNNNLTTTTTNEIKIETSTMMATTINYAAPCCTTTSNFGCNLWVWWNRTRASISSYVGTTGYQPIFTFQVGSLGFEFIIWQNLDFAALSKVPNTSASNSKPSFCFAAGVIGWGWRRTPVAKVPNTATSNSKTWFCFAAGVSHQVRMTTYYPSATTPFFQHGKANPPEFASVQYQCWSFGNESFQI